MNDSIFEGPFSSNKSIIGKKGWLAQAADRGGILGVDPAQMVDATLEGAPMSGVVAPCLYLIPFIDWQNFISLRVFQ